MTDLHAVPAGGADTLRERATVAFEEALAKIEEQRKYALNRAHVLFEKAFRATPEVVDDDGSILVTCEELRFEYQEHPEDPSQFQYVALVHCAGCENDFRTDRAIDTLEKLGRHLAEPIDWTCHICQPPAEVAEPELTAIEKVGRAIADYVGEILVGTRP